MSPTISPRCGDGRAASSPCRVTSTDPGATDYDLDSPGRIVDLYRTVLIEATKPDDLHVFLDQAVLTKLWPSIWLPPHLRRAWEERFPELRRAASEVAAA